MTKALPTENADTRSALRQLCEIVYRPTDANRDAVMAEDWSALPRVAKALADLEAPVTPAALSAVARQLIQDAVEELEPRFPTSPDTVTQIEVVRWHVLDRQPWPSIEAMLLEQGRPHSRGTLIRRQHEFLPYLEQWAANGVSVGHPRRTKLMMAVLSVAVLASLVIAGSIRSGSKPTPAWKDIRSYPIYSKQVCVVDAWPDVQRSLGIDPRPLPELGFSPRGIQILPREGGRNPLALVNALRSGEMPGGVALIDVLSGTLLWETEFVAPREEIKTHRTLPDMVLDDPFQASTALFDPVNTDRLVVPFSNSFSPCFVVQFDIETGEVLSHYVHPGRLETGIAVDLDGDGRTEFVFGGQENVYNRPVIVVLEASNTDGAASTVMWREDDPEEDAVVRTLLPPMYAFQDSTGVPRLRVDDLTPQSWAGSTGTLSVSVCADRRNYAYSAYLDARMEPIDILLGDTATKDWERYGLDVGLAEGLVDGVIVIRGAGRVDRAGGRGN